MQPLNVWTYAFIMSLFGHFNNSLNQSKAIYIPLYSYQSFSSFQYQLNLFIFHIICGLLYGYCIVRSYSAKNYFYRKMAVNKLDFSLTCWYWSIQTPKKVSKNLLVGNFFPATPFYDRKRFIGNLANFIMTLYIHVIHVYRGIWMWRIHSRSRL